MGTWSAALKGNDTFLDSYSIFIERYNKGEDPAAISADMLGDFPGMLQDSDDKNDSLFGLALAQWETKSLSPEVLKQVKEIIESGDDIELWKNSGADNKTLNKRKSTLEKFLKQISVPKEKAKKRTKPKLKIGYRELVNITSADSYTNFYIREQYVNGIYEETLAIITMGIAGAGVFYCNGKDKFITAKWLNTHTLEITYDETIEFRYQDDSCGGPLLDIIYKPVPVRYVKE